MATKSLSKSSVKTDIGLFFTVGIIILWSIYMEVPIMLLLNVLLVTLIVFYCIKSIYKRSSLLAFLFTFSLFILSREILEHYFNYPADDTFSNVINQHLYVSAFLSLFSVWVAYFFAEKSSGNRSFKATLRDENQSQLKTIKRLSLILFYSSIPFVIFTNIYVTIFVSTLGYYSYYTEFSSVLNGNPVLYAISKMGIVMDASFCFFVATFPTKKEFKRPGLFYLMVLLSSIGVGQRSALLLGVALLVFIFFTMQDARPKEQWVKKSYFLYGLLLLPIIALWGVYVNMRRFNTTIDEDVLRNSLSNFFYDQGVTGYVVKRAYQYENLIPKNQVYTLEFLHSGLPAIITGQKVYQGNTLAHATKGGSFTHSLGYAIMGQAYLNGGGTGSSYVAELYYDLGYFGIVLGSMLYGLLLSQFYTLYRRNVLTRAILLLIFTKLLWAPRASYTGFISYLLSPVTIAVLLGIYLIGYRKSAGQTSSSNRQV